MKRSLLLTLSIALSASYASADFFDTTFEELNTAFDLIGKAARKTTKKMRKRIDAMMRDDWTRIPDNPCTVTLDDTSVKITLQAPGIDAQNLKPEIENGIFQLALKTPDYQATLSLNKNQLHIKTTQEHHVEKKVSAEKVEGEQSAEQHVDKHTYYSTQNISRLIPPIDLDSISVEYEKETITITARLIAPTKSKKEVPVIIKN